MSFSIKSQEINLNVCEEKKNWYELQRILASTHAFLAWNVLYYKRVKRWPLSLMSYAVRAIFITKIAQPSPCYVCKKLILFQQEFSYNQENTIAATFVDRSELTFRL